MIKQNKVKDIMERQISRLSINEKLMLSQFVNYQSPVRKCVITDQND